YDLRLYPPSAPRGWLRSKLRTLRRPYSYLFGPDLRRDLEAELARGYDVLHLESLWSGWLALEHTQRALISLPYLFDIDLSDRPPRSLAERARLIMTRRAEHFLLRRFPTISTLTPRLSERVRQISPCSKVHTSPLGLDAALYPFDPDRPPTHEPVVS